MVGPSKILTVSYGTFSCTLEGFDDSFNTMKAIAEYFRDLASEDRYFGAEPPTPDAEMLAKIAEREISRRVDARLDDGGIVLRASALADQSGKAGDATSEQLTAEDHAAAKAERKAAKAAAKAARKAAKAEAKAQAKAREDELAAAEAEAVQNALTAAEAKKRQDAIDRVAADEFQFNESVKSATADKTEGTSGSDVEETRSDAPSSMLAAKDPVPENSPQTAAQPTRTPALSQVPAHPDADSVAAKLQRIRAVVGKSDGNEAAEDGDLDTQFDTPDVADVSADVPPSTKGAAAVAALATPEAVREPADTGGKTPDEIAQDAPSAGPDTTPAPRVVLMKRAEYEKAKEDGTVDAALDQAAKAKTGPDLGLLDGVDDLDEYLEDSDFSDMGVPFDDDADGDETPSRLDAGDAQPDLQEDTVEAATTQGNTADEDDLDVAENVAAQTEDQGTADAENTPATGPHKAEQPEVDDAALDRLMSETDVQMQEPAASRRRNAIAQLKAAVAAKEAARKVGEPDNDGQDVENAFRNDLSQAVVPEAPDSVARPRPVARPETRTERPRPAPLKLVAAQRVDLAGLADTARGAPVMPRRVAARKEATNPQAAGSFAEFAENMGASQLPDLLEAAAAYTSFVEGADEFSRPQILRRVRAVAADDFNREDGLRSFAELLRSGRFTKVRNGRFQVADDSRFNPEKRAG